MAHVRENGLKKEKKTRGASMNVFGYENYQDVRKNLFFYSVPVLIVAGFFGYWMILPVAHQKVVSALFALLSGSEILKGILGSGVGVVLFSAIAFLLTEVFQVHDQLYDKYIVKWRHFYAVDYILPRLVQPFGDRLNYRFLEEAEKRTREFQEDLYYPFVGDRDLKIPKNKLIRFYEVVTPYWLTQINETVLWLLAIMVSIYSFVGPDSVEYRMLLLKDAGILTVAFILNRFFKRIALNKVRRATEEEIRSIHEDKSLLGELESRLKKLCSDYQIPYGARATEDRS
jgi:hypothetical protein